MLINTWNKLIGRQAKVEKHLCQIVEYLPQSNAFVLESMDEKNIQADQYGAPKRKLSQTWTVPVLNEQSNHLHPVLMQFLSQEEVRDWERELIQDT